MSVQVIIGGEPAIPARGFMFRRGPAGQAVSTGTTIDVDTLVESRGVDVSYNTTSNTFTLKAGKTYKLVGALNYVEWTFSTGFANSRWRNVTTNTLFGELGVAQNVASGAANNSGQGIAVAVLTPTGDTEVRLETLNVSGTSPTVGSSTYGLPWAMIEVL